MDQNRCLKYMLLQHNRSARADPDNKEILTIQFKRESCRSLNADNNQRLSERHGKKSLGHVRVVRFTF